MKLIVLTADDVRRLVPMLDAIAAVESAFGQVSSGQAVVPVRTPVETAKGVALFMPGYLRGSSVLGGKVVSVFTGNADAGLPVVSAVVLLLDATTGLPRALLDGTALTALRTGAASGLATRLLARPEARVLAVFGAGAQARTQIEGVRAVRSIEEIRLVDRVPGAAERLAEELRGGGDTVRVDVLDDPAQAVRGADVIVTATTSRSPVFPGAQVTPGVHVNGIGSFTPEMQEVDADLVARATIVVDERSAALAEAGDLIIPIRAGLLSASAIETELGQVALGLRPGRTRDDEITFFKSVGNAAQDLAVAARAVAEAERRREGQIVDL